jgi:hypothetical protein
MTGETVVYCKVCREVAPLSGVVDFNKNCEERRGVRLPVLGMAVWYHRCQKCGLLFTTFADDWDLSDFRTQIYNDDYARVDPDYADTRPLNNAAFIIAETRGTRPEVFDYGAGSHRLAKKLREFGLTAHSHDILDLDGDSGLPREPVDIVTAFEVFEHSPDPITTFIQATAYLKPKGRLYFSTLTLDPTLTDPCHHWYVAPRNGHLTIHTQQSLAIMADAEGLAVKHLGEAYHVAWRV